MLCRVRATGKRAAAARACLSGMPTARAAPSLRLLRSLRLSCSSHAPFMLLLCLFVCLRVCVCVRACMFVGAASGGTGSALLCLDGLWSALRSPLAARPPSHAHAHTHSCQICPIARHASTAGSTTRLRTLKYRAGCSIQHSTCLAQPGAWLCAETFPRALRLARRFPKASCPPTPSLAFTRWQGRRWRQR